MATVIAKVSSKQGKRSKTKKIEIGTGNVLTQVAEHRRICLNHVVLVGDGWDLCFKAQ